MRAITFILLGLAAAVIAAPLAEREYESEFARFIEAHQRKYDSADEFFKRYNIFKANLDIVRDHATKNATYTLAINKFADLTLNEFRALYNKYDPRVDAPTCMTSTGVASEALPASVDWRTKGAVTPVKDQGQCGSCWSFSTTGAIEGAVFLKTGKLTSLSEQELVDCAQSTGNQGCSGGLMQNAFTWVVENKGLCTEAAYPYTATDGTCTKSRCASASTISGCSNVDVNNEVALQTALVQQPISVAVDAATAAWQLYSSGVMPASSCGGADPQLDHGVLAVGYGTQNGKNYWIVKNSWGAGWGQSGYVFLARGSSTNTPGTCGINMSPSYPVV